MVCTIVAHLGSHVTTYVFDCCVFSFSRAHSLPLFSAYISAAAQQSAMISTGAALDGEVLFLVFLSIGFALHRQISSSSFPSEASHNKATASERLVKGSGCMSYFSLRVFSLCNSHPASVKRTPFHIQYYVASSNSVSVLSKLFT